MLTLKELKRMRTSYKNPELLAEDDVLMLIEALEKSQAALTPFADKHDEWIAGYGIPEFDISDYQRAKAAILPKTKK